LVPVLSSLYSLKTLQNNSLSIPKVSSNATPSGVTISPSIKSPFGKTLTATPALKNVKVPPNFKERYILSSPLIIVKPVNVAAIFSPVNPTTCIGPLSVNFKGLLLFSPPSFLTLKLVEFNENSSIIYLVSSECVYSSIPSLELFKS
jgi:hypothetical protein